VDRVGAPGGPRGVGLSQESTRPPLVFQSRVKAPQEIVFRAFFHEPGRWLCRGGNFEPRVGGQLRLCWADGCIEGRLVQFVPPQTGRFTWRFEGDSMPETMVVVSTTAADSADRTTLEVEHYGFGVGPEWDVLYIGAARAWASYLKNLKAVLEVGVDLRDADE
jgi:uncharacterized protein YndB with AHSA1/START domain